MQTESHNLPTLERAKRNFPHRIVRINDVGEMLLQSIDVSKDLLAKGDADVWRQTVEALLHWNVLTPVLVSLDGIDAGDLHDEAISKRLRQLFHRPLFGVYNALPQYHEDTVISMLDSGVANFVFNERAICLQDNVGGVVDIQQSLSSLPRSRLGLRIDDVETMDQKITKWRDYIAHFFIVIHETNDAALSEKAARLLKLLKEPNASVEVYIQFPAGHIPAPSVVTSLLNQSEHLHIAMCPSIRSDRLAADSSTLTLCATTLPDGTYDSVDYFLDQIKTDRPDGLIATVVCDERNQCLGLVYSNTASITAAFLEKRGIYWSRSRQSLWRKGDSSGMVQHLLDFRLDCDRDALKMRVIQAGEPPAFCHLCSYSCWGHCNGGTFSEPAGLQHLQQTLLERKQRAPPGSYTKRLFEDRRLLEQKLLEEAQELIEAETPDDIASEASDLMFFLMVRCVQAGVNVRDIEAYLDLRAKKVRYAATNQINSDLNAAHRCLDAAVVRSQVTRRPGNAKDWRTAHAAQILGTNTSTAASTAVPAASELAPNGSSSK